VGFWILWQGNSVLYRTDYKSIGVALSHDAIFVTCRFHILRTLDMYPLEEFFSQSREIFRYLLRKLVATGNDWPAVVFNVAEARAR
jgi:hypothetical protein